MSTDQPTPTRLSREQLEQIVRFEPANGWQNMFVVRLAADALAYRTALERIYHESSRPDLEVIVVEALGYEPD